MVTSCCTRRTMLFASASMYMHGHRTYSKSIVQPGKVANPARGQLTNVENGYFPVCVRSRLKNWSRETSSAVPSRVSLLIHHTQKAESGAYSRDSSRFPWRRRSFIYTIPPYHTPYWYKVILYLYTHFFFSFLL